MISHAHTPVLLAEVLELLRPRPGGRFVDGTLGWGGHAEAVLRASAPDGWLLGCDRDAVALAAARERLAGDAARCDLRPGNFAELATWIEPGTCDGVLLDLGVSSPQLDDGERGFSFQQDGPLDMRMDRAQALTAADLVNQAPPEELARLFRAYGEEPGAWRVACAIERERAVAPIVTTTRLAELVARVLGRGPKGRHPATRVFQSLRVAVNDELGALERGLVAAWSLLKQHGRLLVITFNSLEDQRVKAFGRERALDYVNPAGVDVPELRQPRPAPLRWVQRKAIRPSAAEVAANPRARSAQLRVMERLRDDPEGRS